MDSSAAHTWDDGLASDITSRLAADFTGWSDDTAKFEAQFERLVNALTAAERDGAEG